MNLLITFSYGTSLKKLEKYGSLTYLVPFCKEITKRNIDLTYLTYGTTKDLSYTEIFNPAKIIPIYKYMKYKSSIINLVKSLLIPLKFKKYFRNADLIRTFQIVGCWVGVIAKILFNKKLLIRTGYEWFIFYLQDQYSRKKKESYHKYLIKYILTYLIEYVAYKLADGIILTSEKDIDFIIKAFKLKKKYKEKKILHLYNYIDTDLFKPMEIPRKNKHVLFIGRLEHQKNLINLIKAFKGLEDFTLDIIGIGTYENRLKELVKKIGVNVNFLGVFPNNSIPKIINQYEIFILPSYYEGNPKVLLESMSCGIPCIGTDVWGISNIITHKENGYLCKIFPDTIRKGIIDLYNNSELRKNIGINARKFIIENCSPEAIAQKEIQFYNKILEKK